MRSPILSRLAAAAVVSAATVMVAAATVPAAAASPTAAVTVAAARPSLNELTGAWCATAARCIAVGVSASNPTNQATGRPLAETWNGKSWRTVPVGLPAGATFGGLFHLACVSAMFCVAVGYEGSGATYYELAEIWNGRTWKPGKPPSPGGGTDDTGLAGVSCVSAKSCVAVGSYDEGGGLPGAAVEKWNGVTWTRVNPPRPAGAVYSALGSVSCTSAKYCVAVGGTYVGVLVESWNGTAWRVISAPRPSADVTVLSGVSCVSPVSCVAVGEYFNPVGGGGGSFAETWNGKAWTMVSVRWPRGTVYTSLADVSCASRAYCVAVGNVGENPTSSQANAGRAAAVAWNGKTWTDMSVPGPAKGKASWFRGVWCGAAASCAAVGYTGAVNASTSTGLSGFWNGKSWKLTGAI